VLEEQPGGEADAADGGMVHAGRDRLGAGAAGRQVDDEVPAVDAGEGA
jgi:hypothetical protein